MQLIIPIVCETPDCPNNGWCFDRVSGIDPALLDAVYESYGTEDGENFCPFCGELGITYDPEEEY